MATGYIGTGAADRDPAIGNDTVTSSKISDDAVTAAKINILDDALAATDAHIMVADGTDFGNVAISGDVTMTNAGVVTIANTSVENAMMAANSVDSDQYVDGSIDNAHLADNAVDGTHIAMGSDAQGDVLFYGGSDYERLAAGTSGYFLKTLGSGADPAWAEVPAGAPTGGGTEKVFYENENSVDSDYTLTTNYNAVSAGPVTVASGVTVTIPAGQAWVIV